MLRAENWGFETPNKRKRMFQKEISEKSTNKNRNNFNTEIDKNFKLNLNSVVQSIPFRKLREENKFNLNSFITNYRESTLSYVLKLLIKEKIYIQILIQIYRDMVERKKKLTEYSKEFERQFTSIKNILYTFLRTPPTSLTYQDKPSYLLQKYYIHLFKLFNKDFTEKINKYITNYKFLTLTIIRLKDKFPLYDGESYIKKTDLPIIQEIYDNLKQKYFFDINDKDGIIDRFIKGPIRNMIDHNNNHGRILTLEKYLRSFKYKSARFNKYGKMEFTF